ncbi:MAG TPA: protein-ADP-ribose hydrolase [Candidatus Choladocola avistercoris]|nr:protein-ADP-ribose hydrolase [Candidatus Choladocola avistercoris]
MNDKKQEERRIWLIRELQREMPQYQDIRIPVTEEEQWNLLRSLFNVRPPYPASQEFLKVQDEYLSELVRSRGIVDAESLPASELDPRITLWQGDITTLRCDAIVNAANSALLGCWQPCHSCIDNMIHSLSGVQLRIKCNEIMQAQGHEEETGTAKITPAYNLPCKYVLHTVGPIISGPLRKEDCDLLAGCYQSCLELAAGNNVRSVAFCCISTGVFHFPQRRAAEIAVETVRQFLETDSSIDRVIFNVFTDRDLAIYQKLLGE